jgi:hypothetical protein
VIQVGLKTYSVRLDEEVYEGLRKALAEHGDPDLNISFLLRRYLRDLYEALPNLKKSDFGLMNNITYWGTFIKQLVRTAQFENLMKGERIVERALAEADDRKAYWKAKKQGKKHE